MAVVIKQQKSIAKVGSAQLDYVIQQRQLLNVLDYVLANSYKQKIDNDSRIAAYKEFEEAKKAEEHNELKEDFCARFGSKNFGLVSEEDELCAQKKEANKKSATATDSSSTTREAIYTPGKSSYTLKIKDLTYTITIWPSDAYPNLNKINKFALKGYLRYLGLSKDKARQLTGVIKDWADSDDFIEEEGAEWSTYSQGVRPYKPRNGPIKNWQELNFLQQIDPDVIPLLRQNFTLQGAEKVNAGYLNNAQIAALAQVEQAVVEKWQALKIKKNDDNSDRLDSDDRQKIESVVTDKSETDAVVIKISAGKNQLTAWFDRESRKIQDWVVTQDLPSQLPLNLDIKD